jgi:hypothetical protein
MVADNISQSLISRRQRFNRAKVRSGTQRLARIAKPAGYGGGFFLRSTRIRDIGHRTTVTCQLTCSWN